MRRGQERERHRRLVAALDGKAPVGDLPLEIDARAIEPRRRAGLQPPALEPERLQRFGELARRRFAGAARGCCSGPM